MMGPSVAIVDYQMGNLFSVTKACEHVGLNATVTSDATKISDSDAVILPGVGAFGNAMERLEALGLDDVLKIHAGSGRPLMGICLGLQLLFEESDEYGCHKGLGIIKGRVTSLPNESGGSVLKIPQIAWNEITKTKEERILSKVNVNSCMYFVHSYYVLPELKEIVLTETEYCGFKYCSSIVAGNIFGFQFHPEKSGTEGLKIYQNFKDIVMGCCDE